MHSASRGEGKGRDRTRDGGKLGHSRNGYKFSFESHLFLSQLNLVTTIKSHRCFCKPTKTFLLQQIPSLKFQAIIIADKAGGKILDQATIDAMNAQGEASRKAREVAIKKCRKKDKERKKEDMKKLSEDARTTSRSERGKGF